MSKPNCLKRNEDKSYTHKYAPNYKIYSVNHDNIPPSCTQSYRRKGWVMIEESLDITDAWLAGNYYYAPDLNNMVELLGSIEVTRVNVQTGESFKEPVTTPYYCSPSSETYWSM